ncbi:MarR family winged helix-turn-helix transcriptional regulator [Isoptericola variabilis]|uniref:Regulatory protein MarR n=1 Tax=Isoptericola variabilis (strain 225) TaxID=743718 RepID=F6FS72_ISOV2|nr:MarR family winged helix-turn-helix transcriptional regulator [Isoptericola variabilis]AEG45169.1 regulatory protein MarR [Isoptericola variabilis 225]TWH31461.1 DNA-binding MarR family transcriptional regulator [Isoptericola variabilis J7]
MTSGENPGETTHEPARDRTVSTGARRAAEAWESLFRTQVTLMRRFRADDIWQDLTIGEYDVLYTLSTGPADGMRLRDLNENVLLAQSSLSRMVDRLAERGLVRRSAAADDARGTVVSLTDEGRELQRTTGRAHVRTIERYVGEALEPDELEELARLLDKLRAAQARIPATGSRR